MATCSFGRLAIVVAILLSVSLPMYRASAQSPISVAGSHDESLTFDGRERTFRVHEPVTGAPESGFPLLIVLHGGGGNGTQKERLTGFSEVADREGFIAVYPDGTGRLPKRLTWDAHNCCGYAYDEQVDDVGFISALIDLMISHYDVNPARVYVTGHSNGAMMTFRLACELSDKIAAAAPYAGALNTENCSPTSPVPMLIMNGTDDQNVPVAGGLSPNAGVASENDRVDQPTAYAVQTWVAANGCDATPVTETNDVTTVSTYGNCTGGATVEQMLIEGWPHTWPNPANGAGIDAAQVIWDFVSQFSMPVA